LAVVDPRVQEHPKLDRSLFADAINDLKSEYDYIVVDSPAVLDSADVNLIADCVHGFVLVARARKTRRRALRSAMEQLAPAPVLGIVVTDSRPAETS
jgi:Mrp family chromosome partitioning ATPase